MKKMLTVLVVLAMMGLLVGCNDETKNVTTESSTYVTTIESSESEEVIEYSINKNPNTDDPAVGMFQVWDGIWHSISAEIDGTIVVILYSTDLGVDQEDGFMIEFNGGPYFIPEGEPLRLLSGHQYDLFVSRVFNTDRGLVVGSGEFFSINPDGEYYPDETFDLETIGEIYTFLYAPKLRVNLSTASLTVFSDGLPDDVKVRFDSIVDDMESIVNYIDLADETITLPEDNWYNSIFAQARIYDVKNNRVIVTESVKASYRIK